MSTEQLADRPFATNGVTDLPVSTISFRDHEKVKIENAALRNIVSECAKALGGGTLISPRATLDFMKALPAEISAVMKRLLPAGAGCCAFDLDECTVTIALDTADQVNQLSQRLPARGRVKVIEPAAAVPTARCTTKNGGYAIVIGPCHSQSGRQHVAYFVAEGSYAGTALCEADGRATGARSPDWDIVEFAPVAAAAPPAAAGPALTLSSVSNVLRILWSIDQSELEEVGLLVGDSAGWARFREDPPYWLIRADDERAAKVWTVIERRMRR